MSKGKLNFIDLFSGAGGLSEGFMRAGFNPIAHVEMNKDACDTLKTRTVYHYLKETNQIDIYYSYLKKKITREEFWDSVPNNLIETVINSEISKDSINCTFKKIDTFLKIKKLI